jgi:hypothetical protein
MRAFDFELVDTIAIDDPWYLPNLMLTKAYGYVPQSFNLGFQEVRSVSYNRTGYRGKVDETKLSGARAVLLVVGLAEELPDVSAYDYQLEEVLRAWMQPRKRIFLHFTEHANSIRKRVSCVSRGINTRAKNFTQREYEYIPLLWEDPRGITESADLIVAEVFPNAPSGAPGRTYTMAYNRSYPAIESTGSVEVTNLGNEDAMPLIQIHGPTTGPVLTNLRTGDAIVFKDAYALTAGNYVTVDVENGLVYFNGNVDDSVHHQLKVPDNEWWTLVPGVNTIRYSSQASDPPSKAVIQYRHTWS